MRIVFESDAQEKMFLYVNINCPNCEIKKSQLLFVVFYSVTEIIIHRNVTLIFFTGSIRLTLLNTFNMQKNLIINIPIFFIHDLFIILYDTYGMGKQQQQHNKNQ